VDGQGPVIIDLPQAVDAAGNNNARSMLERDVNNITAFYGQFAPDLLDSGYAREIWHLYESGALHPEVELTGTFQESTKVADVDSVVQEIQAAFAEEQERRQRLREARGLQPDSFL